MTTEPQCPWNTRPKTLDECLQTIARQNEWEVENGRPAPLGWNMILTKEVFSDLVRRVIALEMSHKW